MVIKINLFSDLVITLKEALVILNIKYAGRHRIMLLLSLATDYLNIEFFHNWIVCKLPLYFNFR